MNPNMAPAKKILVVEDDPAIRTLLHRFLAKHGYQIESASDGKTGMALFEQFAPDLAILDVNLPDALGFNLCQEMRRRTNVFVVILSERVKTEDKITGFSMGADDYCTKPFDLDELRYRVNAIIGRERDRHSENRCLTFGPLVIDAMRCEVHFNDRPIRLTALEFKLLYFLASHCGEVLSREEIKKAVWGYQEDDIGDERVVDVHIGQIRRKVEPTPTQPKFIHTDRGFGYRFEAPLAVRDRN